MTTTDETKSPEPEVQTTPAVETQAQPPKAARAPQRKAPVDAPAAPVRRHAIDAGVKEYGVSLDEISSRGKTVW